jgi:DNA polymerase-3 subunit epsilon
MLYLGTSDTTSTNNSKTDIDWQQYYQQKAQQLETPPLKQFYENGVISGETPISEVPLVAVDFETTGLSPTKNGIVSIGVVPFNLQRVFCSNARQWVLNPRFKLTDKSITVHRITHTDINDAPDLTKVLPELLTLLENKVVVVHYRHIERPFMDAAIKERLGESMLFPLIDTLELEARVHRIKPQSLWNKMRKKQPLSLRLDASRSRYNLPPYQPHHAATDAIASAELLQAQVAHRFTPQTPVSELWC